MIIEIILLVVPFVVFGINLLFIYIASSKEERKNHFLSNKWDEGGKYIFLITALIAYIIAFATSITPICTFANFSYYKEQRETERKDLIDNILYFKSHKDYSYEEYKVLKKEVYTFNHEVEKAKDYNIWWTDFIVADLSYKGLEPIDLNSTLYGICC